MDHEQKIKLEMLLDSFFESNLDMNTEHPNCKYIISEAERDDFEKALKKLLMEKPQSMGYLAFLIYIILWDGGILAIFSYAVFVLHQSPLWFLLAMFLWYSCFKPHHFGIIDTKPEKEKKDW